MGCFHWCNRLSSIHEELMSFLNPPRFIAYFWPFCLGRLQAPVPMPPQVLWPVVRYQAPAPLPLAESEEPPSDPSTASPVVPSNQDIPLTMAQASADLQLTSDLQSADASLPPAETQLPTPDVSGVTMQTLRAGNHFIEFTRWGQ